MSFPPSLSFGSLSRFLWNYTIKSTNHRVVNQPIYLPFIENSIDKPFADWNFLNSFCYKTWEVYKCFKIFWNQSTSYSKKIKFSKLSFILTQIFFKSDRTGLNDYEGRVTDSRNELWTQAARQSNRIRNFFYQFWPLLRATYHPVRYR